MNAQGGGKKLLGHIYCTAVHCSVVVVQCCDPCANRVLRRGGFVVGLLRRGLGASLRGTRQRTIHLRTVPISYRTIYRLVAVDVVDRLCGCPTYSLDKPSKAARRSDTATYGVHVTRRVHVHIPHVRELAIIPHCGLAPRRVPHASSASPANHGAFPAASPRQHQRIRCLFPFSRASTGCRYWQVTSPSHSVPTNRRHLWLFGQSVRSAA